VRNAATLKSSATATVSPSSSSSIPASSDTVRNITVQVLKDVKELRNVSSEWKRLWQQTPEVSAFQALEWILACAEHGAHPNIFAMVLRAGDEPLAIFPTQLSRRGRLSFIGAEIGNYCGPVYVPEALSSVFEAWHDAVSADPRIQSIDLTGLRERSPFLNTLAQCTFSRWGKPAVVEIISCPEVDLREGWDNVFRRHTYHHRANWRRKWNSLTKLGALEFLETSDPDELGAAFPRMRELYAARWQGKHVRGALSPAHYPVQLEAAKALGSRGLVRLSVIRLDGEIAAFSYAMRGAGESTSSFVAHDAALEAFSPGQLLLIKVLEAATARGDTCYDFSLGTMPYKAMWATREQRVFSVLTGRGAGLAARRRRWWRAARSVPILQKLKQQGLKGFSIRKEGAGHLVDWPGLSAGKAEVWHVYLTDEDGQPASRLLKRPLRYFEMRALFSPRLLALAIDRHYRGDQALAVEREGKVIAAIWKAAPHRRSVVTGEYTFPADPGPVYYHPVVAEGEDIKQVATGVANEKSVVVSPRPLAGEGVRKIHTFTGDLWFRS
jgi:CelD/BcsL family acetyltransferase involved in cellulose biosynthesis